MLRAVVYGENSLSLSVTLLPAATASEHYVILRNSKFAAKVRYYFYFVRVNMIITVKNAVRHISCPSQAKYTCMKKIILFVPVIMFLVSTGFAQSFHFGLKGGVDLHKIAGSGFKDKVNAGFHIGAFAEIGLPGKLDLQPEVYYSQVNPETETTVNGVVTPSNISKIKLGYINIPVLITYKLLPVLSIQAGPQFGILVKKDKDAVQNGKDAFKSGDVGIAGGLQLNFTKIKAYARYVAGLNDINNSNSGKWHNQAFHVGLGFRIF